jgi:hypothetical protein
MELFTTKDFMNSDGEHASPEAAARIANARAAEILRERDFLYKVAGAKNEMVKELSKKLSSIIDYCQPHLDEMWAASTIGTILECSFRDSKETLKTKTFGEDPLKNALEFRNRRAE